uniref:Protein kinase domain-containing protein n=1 Tax=Eutreptiella gymnastica TaxID=73025 RepID=A0A7S1IFC1_9EUGL
MWFLPLLGLWFLCSQWHATYILWCKALKKMLEMTGPAFVKFGQWCAVRSDIFPREFCEILSELHSNVSTHSLAHTRQLIKDQFGKDVEELFTEFNPVPIGSGSIAQVYFGTLKETNEEVAIKVMHPKVKEKIAVDFFCLQMFAKIVDHTAPWMDYPGIAAQFAQNLSLQVDLRVEAENLRYFNKNFETSKYIIFPKPIMESEQVLVETKINGQPLNEWYGGDGDVSPAHRRLAQAGADLFLQMVLTDNFFHADIHPGNCLVGKLPGDDHVFLAMLDVGVCQTLSKHQRDISHEFLRTIVMGDWGGVAQSILNMSHTQDFCDVPGFRKRITQICDELMPPRPTETWSEFVIHYARLYGFAARYGKKVGFTTTFVESIFDAIQEYRVRIDPAYAHLLFSCIAMEFISNQCDPSMDMIKHSAPWFVSSMMNRPKRAAW